jgi:hypothetical protein
VGRKGTGAATVVSWVLAIARGLLTLALVLLALFTVVAPFTNAWDVEVDAAFVAIGTRMKIPVRFYVDTATHHITAPSIGVQRAELIDTHGSLRFSAPTGSFRLVNTAFLAVLLILALWGLQQLHAVFSTLRQGQPFVRANASRLRLVAFTVIAGELLGASMVAYNQFYAKAHFTATGLLFDWSFNIDGFVVVLGLIILAIAEVFAAGSRLDEDQALTI